MSAADRAGATAVPHPLREYALLADGERGALVGPRGDLAWMCFPRWHDDAAFCALLGGRSAYAVSPAGRFTWGGFYEPGGLIWRSRWATESGIVISREALALPGRREQAVVLRRIEARDGPAAVDVTLVAGAGFDRHGMARLRREDDGAWRADLGEERLAWFGAAAAEVREDGGKALALRLELEPGESHDLVLALAHGEPPDPLPPAEELWQATEEGWRERVPDFEQSLAPRDSRHAYAVLSGLTSADGGMVAAATSSLPERAEQGRSYDYRYAWIRDQAYAGQAAAAAGAHHLLDTAVQFVSARLLADGAATAPAYTVGGDPVPPERHLDLPGYPGGVDVVGNRVRDQFQLDLFGEALLLFAAAARHDGLDGEAWRAAEVAAEAIAARRDEPEAGIWELEPRLWTHSRLICAAGLRELAGQRPGGEQAAKWQALADALVADASAHSLHRDGRWQRAPDDERVDAALLLAAIRGAVPAEDSRSRATLDAVAAELTEDGYCYRYRADDRPLGEAEGAFLLCGFWLALAHAEQGDREAALRWFERTRASSGPPGLLAEEFDVTQRQLRGNLPQAFVHALLLECAVSLERPSFRSRPPSPGCASA
jgi:GH15 family glucan-1,4-alpha-glucosidase